MNTQIGEFERLSAQITLRLNPDEKASRDFLAVIAKLKSGILGRDQPFSGDNIKELDQLRFELLTRGRGILKKEWKRVKAGEAMFQAVKWGALAVLLALMVVVFSYHRVGQ